jgi:hypothetical protein
MAREPSISSQDLRSEIAEIFERHQVNVHVEIRPHSTRFVHGPVFWFVRVVIDGAVFEVVKWLGTAGVEEIRTLLSRPADGEVVDVTIADSDGTSLSIPAQLPDKAMDTLMRIDWSALPRSGEIVWSERRGRWERPEAVPLKYDEAAGAEPSDRGDASRGLDAM